MAHFSGNAAQHHHVDGVDATQYRHGDNTIVENIQFSIAQKSGANKRNEKRYVSYVPTPSCSQIFGQQSGRRRWARHARDVKSHHTTTHWCPIQSLQLIFADDSTIRGRCVTRYREGGPSYKLGRHVGRRVLSWMLANNFSLTLWPTDLTNKFDKN